MTIQIVKLVTGEEVIGDVEQNGGYIIKKPCALQLVPSRSNPEQPMMALIPYAPYVEDHTVQVSKESVLWIHTPVKELYNQYNSVFGTGIQLTV